ncbi:MAG: hypothetical protein OXB84_06665, partial [Halobacteriovoraceae bacterium]|nr:hypothetical protein [Halobacteriovoraceae bacterium]
MRNQLLIWKRLKRKNEIKIVNADKTKPIELIKDASSANLICLLSLNPMIVNSLFFLRKKLLINCPFLIYLYGNASRGCFYFHLYGLNKILSSRDCFIASCEAEARALNLCYKNALVKVIPFYVNGYHNKEKQIKHKKSKMSFVYAGRVS